MLKLWGRSQQLQAFAHRAAATGWTRRDWEFVDIEYADDPTNPFDMKNPGAVAGEEGDGWAYLVLPPGAEDA